MNYPAASSGVSKTKNRKKKSPQSGWELNPKRLKNKLKNSRLNLMHYITSKTIFITG
jgi:hypothetical protein